MKNFIRTKTEDGHVLLNTDAIIRVCEKFGKAEIKMNDGEIFKSLEIYGAIKNKIHAACSLD